MTQNDVREYRPFLHISLPKMNNRFVILSIVLFGVCVAGRDFYKILGVDKYDVISLE